jgi:hypothetical protein
MPTDRGASGPRRQGPGDRLRPGVAGPGQIHPIVGVDQDESSIERARPGSPAINGRLSTPRATGSAPNAGCGCLASTKNGV